MRCASLVVMAATAAACGRRPQSAQTAATWAVSESPTVLILDVPGHEFNGVSSALRLASGQVLVANAGVPELDLFDTAGRFIRSIGRKGRGPGEWQGPISVFAWHADSVAVYDPAAIRWTILDPGLAVARTAPAPDSMIRQPTWLYQGAIVSDGVREAPPAWTLTVLAEARRSDVGFSRLLHGRRDDLGALWIRDSVDQSRWQVHTDTAGARASVHVPDGFEPLQIGRDFLLGVERDSLDAERLTLRSLRRAPEPVVERGPDVGVLPTDSAVLGALPSLLMAQELYYANHATYAPSADSLQLRTPFPFRLFILAGDARRWSAVVVVTATGATCGLSVGWPSPSGWLDGTPFCGR